MTKTTYMLGFVVAIEFGVSLDFERKKIYVTTGKSVNKPIKRRNILKPIENRGTITKEEKDHAYIIRAARGQRINERLDRGVDKSLRIRGLSSRYLEQSTGTRRDYKLSPDIVKRTRQVLHISAESRF